MKKQKKLSLLRILENWKLFQISGKEFLVKSPSGTLKLFSKKSDAERYMLYSFYKELERPKRQKKKSTAKKKSKPFNATMASMTNKRIMEMSIIDSEKKIRLLYDYKTEYYVVFNGAFNQTHYTKLFQQAIRYFNHLVDIS